MDLTEYKLKTIFHECRQCGVCCRKYPKILLHEEEVEFIKKMGGHAGYLVPLKKFREKSLSEVIREEQQKDNMYMIHPDAKGCVFLGKRNDKYYCKIYHFRPKVCRGFKCNMSDNTMNDLFLNEPIHFLGMDKYGRQL